jgi:tRNA nucleotidyltransferase/poly(A) polymerase
MMRAARFASQLGFTPVVDVLLAATEMSERIKLFRRKESETNSVS